ncbi:MAG: F0F1 ATP synthase subunit delta [Proteobacteria bacterium]|nr:F0F1 ATP synthase subunit delta [Pseudomonadota bacterium]
MEFDWTTFALEVVNFLVLVWLLQRLLYKPVTNAIAERKAAIEKTLADARSLEAAALSLKQHYESRMAEWEEEKARAQVKLGSEVEAERARLMDALRASLEQERERARALEERRILELRHKMEEGALAEGARFAANLLSRLASPDLEEKIRVLLIEDLPQLGDADLQSLRAAFKDEHARIRVTSRYPIAEPQRASLSEALGRVAGTPVACEFGPDPDLVAGLRISIGSWVLRCNLQDELKFFAENRHAGF